MADRNHCARERALSLEDGVTVVFHNVDSHGKNSGDGGGDDDDEGGEDERTAARVRLSYDYGDDAEEARGGERSPEGSGRRTLCPPPCCVRSGGLASAPDGNPGEGKSAHSRCGFGDMKAGSDNLSSISRALCDGKKMRTQYALRAEQPEKR
ncbi:hypothetical protein EYF80_039518 [Liparis tanakae]|uniref:Uncharacterized protein n=1 Tax=Liparis tanakae TaxID=230148 RepID=A0A4Z2GBL0_9TELE|nr:hypothetical protein EYF80_039518 [Liparis tanakae]